MRLLLVLSVACTTGLELSPAALASAVTRASLTPDSLSVGAVRNTLVFQFTATTALSNSDGTITVSVPTGGSFGENAGDNCGTNFHNDCIVLDVTTDTAGQAGWVAGSGTSLTMTSPINISPGDSVVVTIANASNGPTQGASGFSVATSSDPSPVSFSTETLVHETSVTDPSLTVSSLAGGATNVSLTATFTATNALTADVPTHNDGSQGRALDDPSAITLTAPAGSSFSENTTKMCVVGDVVCTVVDETTHIEGGASWVGGSGATLIVGVPFNIAAGDVLQVLIPGGLNNPPTTGDGSGFSFSTSSDPGAVSPVAASEDAPSAPSVTSTSASPGQSTASIGADVNPGGQTTTVSVRYDLGSSPWCTSGGSSGSPAYTAGGGTLGETDSSPHSYVIILSNLTPATSYCAEMVAQNSSGTAHSASPVTFTTTAPPPLVAGGTPYNDNPGAPIMYTFNVTVAGSGLGTVSGSGITCPGTCSQRYASGTKVSLSAVPASGSKFAGWTGACARLGQCQVIVDKNQSVGATFYTVAAQGPPKCRLTPDGATVRVPRSSLGHGSKGQRFAGTLAIRAKCDQSAAATLTGKLTETNGKTRKVVTFQLEPLHASLRANQVQVLRIRLPAAAVATLRRSVRTTASLTLSARGANGASRTTTTVPRIRGIA